MSKDTKGLRLIFKDCTDCTMSGQIQHYVGDNSIPVAEGNTTYKIPEKLSKLIFKAESVLNICACEITKSLPNGHNIIRFIELPPKDNVVINERPMKINAKLKKVIDEMPDQNYKYLAFSYNNEIPTSAVDLDIDIAINTNDELPVILKFYEVISELKSFSKLLDDLEKSDKSKSKKSKNKKTSSKKKNKKKK